MATLTAPPPAVVATFHRLVAEWREATRFLSSSGSDHPAYRAIVALGPDVVPLLLEELAKSTDLWFAALRELTGVDPVPHADRSRPSASASHWLAWGRANGLV